MQFERVLLVNPPYPGSMERGTLRAGLGYLAQALEQAGIEYDLFDMELDYNVGHLGQRIRAFAPDLIGVSIMTYKYKHTYRLLGCIKSMTSVPIVVGGPHISALRETVLRECSSVDFGVVGEGEETIVEVCRAGNLTEVKGLIYRRDGDVVSNDERSFIKDLDAVPYPRYGKFELNKYVSRAIPIVSSRGCPYSCIFCSVKASMGGKVRARSPVNVLEEIEYWYGKGRRRFGFVDDNFTFYTDRVLDICDLIEKRGLRGLELLCINGLRADKVTRQLLERMRQVGFCSVAFGVEGGNDKILKNVKKGEKLETIRQAIEAACDLDYEVTLHFVIGTPGETEEDIEDSFSLARQYPISNVYFNNLMPYPGTELYDWVQSKGYFAADPAEYFDSISSWADTPVFETPELTLSQRRQALLKGKQIMRQVRKEHFKRKLRQYRLLGRFIGRLLFWMDTAKGLLRGTKIGRAVVRHLKPFLSK